MSRNRAVVVDPDAPGRLVIRPVADPAPERAEAVVRVQAISLNRGEVRRSGMAAAGWRPGWDLAGVVERAAAGGSGPPGGPRRGGFLLGGARGRRRARRGGRLGPGRGNARRRVPAGRRVGAARRRPEERAG